MHTIKTSALTFIAIIACLMLLKPDAYRGEAPKNAPLPAQQKSPATIPQQVLFQSEPVQSATEPDQSLPVAHHRQESIAAISATTQSIDWTPILYPELSRIAELEKQPTDAALVELVPMLSNEDPAVRLAAIEALGDMTLEATIPLLSMALNDPHSQVRIVALEALDSHDDKSVASSIESCLYDQDRDVRLTAIETLSDFESATVVHALASLLSDPDWQIRQHAVNALGEIGGDNVVLYLRQARYDPYATIRANADAILAELEKN